MSNNTKTKNIFLNRLKHQIWCDLVIGRSDNDKVQWSDENITKYINNLEKTLHRCVEDAKEDLDDVPNDGVREYLYELFDTFDGLDDEKDELDEDKHDWSRESPYEQ